MVRLALSELPAIRTERRRDRQMSGLPTTRPESVNGGAHQVTRARFDCTRWPSPARGYSANVHVAPRRQRDVAIHRTMEKNITGCPQSRQGGDHLAARRLVRSAGVRNALLRDLHEVKTQSGLPER